ncbi:MAG: GNAT family N-acetyltransferase [bacterium]
MTENPDEQRYELRVDGELIGLADYYDRDGVRVIPHTEVRPSREGQGLGAVLVRCALDDIRAKGMSVGPACPFVGHFLRRHPEYADLAH